MNAPQIPKTLLEYLQGVFPDKIPETYQNPEQIGRLIGQQMVVKHLLTAYNVQNRTVLRAN